MVLALGCNCHGLDALDQSIHRPFYENRNCVAVVGRQPRGSDAFRTSGHRRRSSGSAEFCWAQYGSNIAVRPTPAIFHTAPDFGLEATGAVLALPLATSSALLVAVWFLRSFFRNPVKYVSSPPISLRYAAYTLIGLIAYAVLINVDAVAVKRFFSEAAAGDYAAVVTLGKINLFATLGIGLVLFPKATQRHAKGEDGGQSWGWRWQRRSQLGSV